MEYDCTKPLGDALESYMETDLSSICTELALRGIVYESQFERLYSMVCKKNASELVRLFHKRTRLGIAYGYDQITCNFFFYNMDMYSSEEAMRLSVDFQSKQME